MGIPVCYRNDLRLTWRPRDLICFIKVFEIISFLNQKLSTNLKYHLFVSFFERNSFSCALEMRYIQIVFTAATLIFLTTKRLPGNLSHFPKEVIVSS